MNQSKVLFNSILFNQVPAAEALNSKKQKFVIKKLNSLNNLFLTKTSNYPEIIEKAKLIKRSIELGLKLFELESNTKNQKKIFPFSEQSSVEPKNLTLLKIDNSKSPNHTLRSDVYLNELIKTKGNSIRKAKKKEILNFPVIKHRDFCFDSIKREDINDHYKKRETFKNMLSYDQHVKKPFK